MRHVIMPLLAAAGTILFTAPAHADLGDQLFKLLPDDGAPFDVFGYSVAIRGDTAIIGAFFGGLNGDFPGSAYLFDATTGRQIAKLLADDGAAGDEFGNSVAISGATAIIGAVEDEDNGNHSGSAYLFDVSDPANPVQFAKLLPEDGAVGDRFGVSVAISGAIAIIGAFEDNDNGNHSGSAYLFDATTGAQIAKLLPDDGAEEDNFGVSVAISGDTAIVGANLDSDNGPLSGSAYLFDTSTGAQIAKLLPDDGALLDQFGVSVAISGVTAIVGTPWDDNNGGGSGSAYLFDISDPANPVQIAKLLAEGGGEGDRFGFSVATSGAIAIIGAFLNNDNGLNSGSAYLFDISDPANPLQIAKLLPNDSAINDFFGFSVAISGAPGNETAIVGAYLDDDNGDNSGSAYLFDASVPGTCPWDLNGDSAVGLSDLLALLADWGPSKDCPADFDGDGTVGPSDLLALLANWGPCP